MADLDTTSKTTFLGTRAAYSPNEFSTLVGTGIATTRRRIADLSIPTVKLGNRRLIPGSYVESIFRGETE